MKTSPASMIRAACAALFLLVAADAASAQFTTAIVGPTTINEGETWNGSVLISSQSPNGVRIERFNGGSVSYSGGTPSTQSIPLINPFGSLPPYASGELVPSMNFGISTVFFQDGSAGMTFSGSVNAHSFAGNPNDWPFLGTINVNDAHSVTVLNVAPTIVSATQYGNNGEIIVYEGTTVPLQMQSQDPGSDVQTFSINGQNAGIVSQTGGTVRTSNVINRVFLDQGSFSNLFMVNDGDGPSTSIARIAHVLNVAPTLATFQLNGTTGPLTVNEGASVLAQLTAIDPGTDFVGFTIDGVGAGTGGSTAGSVRTSGVVQVGNRDDGVYQISGVLDDFEGGVNNVTSNTLTVLNLDPVLMSFSLPSTVALGQVFGFNSLATDWDSLLYEWDLDGDGGYDDFLGNTGFHVFTTNGLKTVGLRVADGDGGFAYGSGQIIAGNLNAVPEPTSLALLGTGLLGLCGYGARRRRAAIRT